MKIVSSYKKRLKIFKPDLTNLRLDYRTGEAEMTMHLHVPIEGRLGKSVIVPGSTGFAIVDMHDSLGRRIDTVWKKTKKGLSLSARNLPRDSEHFILRASGSIPKDGLGCFVETRMATDCYDLKGEDVYWISCAITETGLEAWKKIYKELTIRNVAMSVRVGVQRCFTTSIPHSIHVVLEARREYELAKATKDRNRIAVAKHRLESVKQIPVTENEILEAVADLLARPHFEGFVYATEPFDVGDIQGEILRTSPLPKSMMIEAYTDLGYQKRNANGRLCFKREEYKKAVKERLEKLLP